MTKKTGVILFVDNSAESRPRKSRANVHNKHNEGRKEEDGRSGRRVPPKMDWQSSKLINSSFTRYVSVTSLFSQSSSIILNKQFDANSDIQLLFSATCREPPVFYTGIQCKFSGFFNKKKEFVISEKMAILPPDPAYLLRSDMGPVHSLLFRVSPYIEHIYAGTESGKIHIWDLKV